MDRWSLSGSCNSLLKWPYRIDLMPFLIYIELVRNLRRRRGSLFGLAQAKKTSFETCKSRESGHL